MLVDPTLLSLSLSSLAATLQLTTQLTFVKISQVLTKPLARKPKLELVN